MAERDFTFCFKGSRDYVHGTDMYNAMMPWLQETCAPHIEQIDLAIHQIVRHGLTGTLHAVDAPLEGSPAVVLRFTAEGTRYKATFVENTTPVDCSYAYDEDAIAVGAAIDVPTRTLHIRNASAYSAIEVLVALNKQLVQHVVQGPGKWYFTRLVLQRPLPSVADAAIALQVTAVMGARMTRTALQVNGQSIGEMYFTKVAPA